MKFFNDFYDKELLERLYFIIHSEFGHVTYTEAIDLLLQAGDRFEYPVSPGALTCRLSMSVTSPSRCSKAPVCHRLPQGRSKPSTCGSTTTAKPLPRWTFWSPALADHRRKPA